MTFHEMPMHKRWKSMDDEAMSVFAAVWPNNFIRYGLDRAPIGTRNWPDKWRFTPDCADRYGMIEVQGFGRDRLLKIKDGKRAALNQWWGDAILGKGVTVKFFIWDTTEQRWAAPEWSVIDELLEDPHVVDAYHDGPTYRALHATQLAHLAWKPYDPTPRDPN